MLNNLRRRGLSSDGDMNRRRSEYFAMEPPTSIPQGRASEQIPRNVSSAHFLSPAVAATKTTPSPLDTSTPRLPPALRPGSPPTQDEHPKHRRFSMMKFRNASDPQLSARARLQAAQASEAPPPLPKPPEIIKTAPTVDVNARPTKKKSRMRLPGRHKTSGDSTSSGQAAPFLEEPSVLEKKERRKTMSGETAKSRVTFDQPERPVTQGRAAPPPPYGDESASSLALPINRLSESSRSEGSSGDHPDHGVYASTTTTTHIVSTTTTFFRLPRRKKAGPLFPLPARVNGTESSFSSTRPSFSNVRPPTGRHGEESAAVAALRHPPSGEDLSNHGLPSPLPSPTASPENHVQNTLARTSMTFAAPGAPLLRRDSRTSVASSPTRHRRIGLRERSSTMDSTPSTVNDPLPTPAVPSLSTRTSTSTGRKSFGDLFSLSHRLRQNSEPPFPKHPSGPATPASNPNSKGNSMQLAREPLVIPERLDDDTPAKYLVRLEEAVSRGVVASVLSKGSDQFSQAVLRSYMRGFAFFGDPLDMAIRKLLMEVELPKETQHIDRCLQSFANRYYECNPGIYASPDQAYFIAFSLLILHTDVFNKNNKHKMQKHDYLKNTQGEGISDDILECFYDNISYTPFIHVEDDLDINGERIIQHKMKKKSMLFPLVSPDSSRRNSKEPVDPYTLIIDGKLESLRPNLKDVMHVEEHYSYLGTAASLDLHNLQKTFFKTGVLQIISARSRPDAFMSERTVTNPDEAGPGIVDIKITKVGLLWRKDPKKKKTRSPWQEWGAILTGAQLYFFRNTAWIKNLMHQQDTHQKQGHDGIPVLFKPPIESFKPDALMSTDDSVALLDSTYNKHKNAFVFVRHGGFEEVFLADNQDEMNDWLAKLNYAAAFRTSGVRMRGVVGGNYDGQRTRGIRRLDQSAGIGQSVQTPTGEVTIISGRIDTQMAQDILTARREIMMQKISESEEKLSSSQKQLDAHLRNARHLQILAPIQPKTRDQVLLAAGRMAAKLKWLRLEMWRLRCHKEILAMDLDEENKILRVDGLQSKTGALDRPSTTQTESVAAGIPTPLGSPRSVSDSVQPLQSALQSPCIDKESSLDDIFQTPPQTSSFHKQQASWELPHFAFDNRSRKKSVSSSHSLGVPPHAYVPSRTGSYPVTSPEKPLPSTPPQIDAAEQEILQQAGLETENTPDSKLRGPETPTKHNSDEAKDQEETPGGGTEKSRDKIRRSLHRTLRDAQNHVPGATHHRSRKGKDSNSSAGLSNEENDDILARGTGSFVVHGKKASVITFGTELQSMSAEERLRLRQVNRDTSGALTKLDDDFGSVLIEPVEFHDAGEGKMERRASAASEATARSFRDLHRRLSTLAPGMSGVEGLDERSEVVSLASDHESGSSLAVPKLRGGSITAGEDRLSVSRGSSRGNDSSHHQAIFYTPERSITPNGNPTLSPITTPVATEREFPLQKTEMTSEKSGEHSHEETVGA